MLIIVSGAIGRCCGMGGLAWVYMQYLAGLRELGHDVYYLEDCGEGSWVYNWDLQETVTDLRYPASYVTDCLDGIGLAGKWIYRAGDDCEGISIADFSDICAQADLMIMHTVPITVWRPEYDLPRRRTFIDVDPGFSQMMLANGDRDLHYAVDRCERVFTIGQRFGAPDCPVPDAGREWLKTRPPVFLPDWPQVSEGTGEFFTSVMQWRGFKDISFNGFDYGQKDKEYPKFIDLPQKTSQPFLIGVIGAPPDLLSQHGWTAISGEDTARTPWTYRKFIQDSRAEFGVAKHGYVSMRSGWFSDRSVCYLASGRPVLLQDTGQSDWLPVGEGIFIFSDQTEALQGVDAINADYELQRQQARRIAKEYFSTDHVLTALLDQAML